MSADIRIAVSFPHHRKTKKLMLRAGRDAAWSLVCLWCEVAQSAPKGDISSWSNEDIALAAQWDKDPDAFVKALIDSGFLDEALNDDGKVTRTLHDWGEHNPWVFYSEERSAQSRRAIRARWDRKLKDDDTERIRSVYDANTDRNTPFPFPSPSPFPFPEKTKDVGRVDSEESLSPPSRGNGTGKGKDKTVPDDQWIASLSGRPAYAGVDVVAQVDKCVLWCETHRVQPTRRRIINWLNRIERPVTVEEAWQRAIREAEGK